MNQTRKALVLVVNPYIHDSRVERTSELLVDLGFETSTPAIQTGKLRPTEKSATSGLPMIGSRLPKIERLVEKSGSGFCYEPGNSEDLAAKIHRMMEDRELRESCAENSMELAKLNTWEAEKFRNRLGAHFDHSCTGQPIQRLPQNQRPE